LDGSVKELENFATFAVTLKRRGRKWGWSISSNESEIVMLGYERSRSAARYHANKALFQLLCSAHYRSAPPLGISRRACHHGMWWPAAA
jgi:hypothetical protein